MNQLLDTDDFSSPSIFHLRFQSTNKLDNKASEVIAPNTDPAQYDPKSRAAAAHRRSPGKLPHL